MGTSVSSKKPRNTVPTGPPQRPGSHVPGAAPSSLDRICTVAPLSGEGAWVSGECRGRPRSHGSAKPGLKPSSREVQIITPRLSKESRSVSISGAYRPGAAHQQRGDTRPKKGRPGNQTDSGPNPSSGPATSHSLDDFIHEMGIY